jgi:hypothetical protein
LFGLPAAAIGLLATLSGVASGGQGAERPLLQVEAPPELERQAAAVRALAGTDWGVSARMVGLPTPVSPIRVVLASERSPAAAAVASWVSGFAVGETSTIVLFPARVPSYPDGNLETLLRHEVAHVLMSRATGHRPGPRWFEEGVATVAAREWGVEDGARLAIATIGPGPRTLAEVDAGFLSDGRGVSRAYAVSAALVRFLLRRHGESAVAAVASRLARGVSFEDAFEAVTGETPGEFARAYFGREALLATWVPFLTSATGLWMGITALALLAIRRRRARDQALRDAWAAEEELAALQARPPAEDNSGDWN